MTLKQLICRYIYQRVLGWKTNVTVETPERCVICVAPHTSNWDLIMGKLFYGMQGMKASFMMKSSWFVFPLGYMFKAIGGIPVHRGKNHSLTDQMASRFAKEKHFQLAITPEGTRKANAEWKRGFYYIAFKANVPIMLYELNYGTKTVSCTRIVVPTGDIEKELADIKDYYRHSIGKKADRFKI